MLATIGVILLAVSLVNSDEVISKCCDNEYILDESLQCTSIQDTMTQSFFQAINETGAVYSVCVTNRSLTALRNLEDNTTAGRLCKDINRNGTIITLACHRMDQNNGMSNECDSLLTVLDFWGATIVVFATMLYTIPYVLVIGIYCVLPELRVRAYDKSVVAFNASYITLNSFLIFIGSHELCHKILPPIAYGIMGLIIVYLTQTCCLWLFVICIDMTSVITRFHWKPAGDSKKRSDEKKFRVYSKWVWGLAMVPTIIALITEFNPFLPEDSIFRPKISDFHGEHSTSLVFYNLSLPVLTLFSNTLLFIYTTYKVIRIQRDNAILNQNSVKNAKKKYFLYLKLYLIMDTPWLSGTLSAVFPGLWYLKFVRIIQPILMLIVIIPRERMIAAFGCLKNTSKKIRMHRFQKEIVNPQDIENTAGQNDIMKPLNDNVTPADG